ncbi:MAG: sulfite exporter TauE/SafE family protein, partial [Staphylococcus lugdunensis]|nr:sulfite exporter TauE/SafE family protein [Staphylococcus lugdunensis]
WLVVALSIGGMAAAPISAYLTKILPINILAICVGGLIIFTNSNALLSYFVDNSTIINVIRFAIICSILVLIIFVAIRNRLLSFSYKKNRVNKYN